jgi:hypothetical protein
MYLLRMCVCVCVCVCVCLCWKVSDYFPVTVTILRLGYPSNALSSSASVVCIVLPVSGDKKLAPSYLEFLKQCVASRYLSQCSN